MDAFHLKILASATILGALGGCVNPTPHLDREFGRAVDAAKAQQTINPDASKNADPVAGIEGQAAKDSIERYYDSFKRPPPTFTIIDIGGGLGTGGGR
jgi:hypothetical protein